MTALRSAGLRAELSPHLGEEQLDRLADIGVPVAADVTAHYVDVWNSGRAQRAGDERLRRPGAHHPRRAPMVSSPSSSSMRISPRFVEPDVNVIDKGGHWVHVEYPGSVASMILDFTDAIAGVTP